MKITSGSFTFSPFVTLLSLCLAGLMIAASVWQWHRYQYKLELQERFSTHSIEEGTFLSPTMLNNSASDYLNEKVVVKGTFDLERQMIVINRSNGTQPGYWLLTPLRLADSDAALLISRGFIPFEADSASAWQEYNYPELQQPTDIAVVLKSGVPRRNWFAPINPPGEAEKEFKEKWAYVDVSDIAEQFDYPLVPKVYGQQLNPLATVGFPEQAIHIGLPPSTHFWYSIEWILLAMSTLAGGVALQMFPKRRRRHFRNFEQESVACLAALFCLGFLLSAEHALATSNPQEVKEKAKVVEHLGDTIDTDLRFRNAEGQEVRLSELSPQGRPILLAPVYYECPELCGLTQTGLAKVLNELELQLGEDYSVVSLSFDPEETPEFAAKKARLYREQLESIPEENRNAWHFLVGSQENIKAITEDIGFYYEEDGVDFMHAAVVAVLTPKGVISRYLYGIRFPKKDVELALVEASEGKVGSLVQRALMFCFRYDHIQGRYTLSIMKVIRIVCLGFFLLLAACLLWLRVKERGRPSNE